MSTRVLRKAARVAVFVAALAPLAVLLADLFGHRLGPEPIRAVELRTGQWGLVFLVATLAVTPLRRFTGWNVLGGYRRMLGLYAFTYITLHFLTWLGVDQFFALQYVGKDIAKRPYIAVGFLSFLLMIPLALTSSSRMVRRLGKRWAQLHALVYVAALGGIVHFVWSVKADLGKPTTYALIVVALLLLRFVPREAFALLRPAGPAARPAQGDRRLTPAA